ncbi:MAG: undecaprenyl/decaprenyl-phosphate alpha-N-acetylglucosaminyl 1-phosphate transferase [Armatimonadetes bacterium]|nr:undecaprenyl/decaprenyl-phosphate alpha-N-acetylglucosaminyl 1-phosphate transferase [Armatimonadota bacterium]
MNIPPYLVAAAVAFIVTYAIALEMQWIARRLGAVTPPGGRHIHTRPIPRMGGLAIFGGVIVALLVALPIDSPVALVREPRYLILAVPYRPLAAPLLGVILGAVAITLLGAIDDLRALPGRLKFPLIYAAAAIPVAFGLTTSFLTNPVHGTMIPLGVAGKIFTVVWLGSMAIALNSIDGVDGLAAGIAGITGATLLMAAAPRVDVTTMTLAAAVIGASIGFLRHNFHPARIFMGDSGSMLLGFLLGAASVNGLFKTATALSLAIPVLALAVPIADTGYAIVRRYRKSVSIFLPDREHFHHRLLDRGLTQRQTAFVLYLLSAVFGLGGLAVAGINRTASLWVLGTITLALLVLARRLGLFRLRSAASADLPDPADLR